MYVVLEMELPASCMLAKRSTTTPCHSPTFLWARVSQPRHKLLSLLLEFTEDWDFMHNCAQHFSSTWKGTSLLRCSMCLALGLFLKDLHCSDYLRWGLKMVSYQRRKLRLRRLTTHKQWNHIWNQIHWPPTRQQVSWYVTMKGNVAEEVLSAPSLSEVKGPWVQSLQWQTWSVIYLPTLQAPQAQREALLLLIPPLSMGPNITP